MRITRDTLLRIAKETVQQRTFKDQKIVAAYLTGSLLNEDPFLGGTTDIDLVFVHAEPPAATREVVALSQDFHLDITHHSKKEYDPPRELRANPWLGYEIYDPMLLYETQHFFEFTQASLRAGFTDPEAVIQRAYSLLSHARQIWMDLQFIENAGPNDIAKYLKSLNHAVNAVAELSGPPLSERRMLRQFPVRADAIERPHFAARLLGLIGGTKAADTVYLTNWLPQWRDAFDAATESARVDGRIHPARVGYYQKAFLSMLEGEDPTAMLWPLLRTWTLAVSVLPAEQSAAWKDACDYLGLTGGGFYDRIQGLDLFLDDIEEILEDMATSNGLEITGTSL